jgi:hypothetical protein
MSSFDRGPMNGLIRQANKVVGTVCLSESSDSFVEQFNRCYGGLQMRAEGDTPATFDPRRQMPRTGPTYRPAVANPTARWKRNP